MKILLLDIETSPNTAHVWGLWQQNVGINQLLESSYVMCWAAKWYGEKTVHFGKDLKKIYNMINEADVVIHYNGKKFDMPTLNKEFLLNGWTPPAPYKQIDLLRVVRSQFRFPSNKLDYVAQRLGLGKKVAHEGHELWIKCMAGDAAAWNKMSEAAKKEASPIYKEIKNNQDILEGLISLGFQNLLKSMGIKEIGINEFEVTDFSKAASTLRREVLKREVNDNIAFVLQRVEKNIYLLNEGKKIIKEIKNNLICKC